MDTIYTVIIVIVIIAIAYAVYHFWEGSDGPGPRDPPPGRLPVPTGLTFITDGSVATVTWSKVPGAISYKVYMGDVSGKYDKTFPVLEAKAVITSLSPCGKMYLAVKAVSKDVSSMLSDELTVSAESPPVPKIKSVRQMTRNNVFIVAESVVGKLEGIAGVSPDKLDLPSKPTSASSIFFDIARYEPCVPIYYRIRDTVSASCSSAYGELFVFRDVSAPAPVTVIDAVGRDPRTGDVRVVWKKLEGEVQYELQLKQSDIMWKTLYGPTGDTVVNLKYPLIPSGIQAVFRVKTKQIAACPSYSQHATLKAI